MLLDLRVYLLLTDPIPVDVLEEGVLSGVLDSFLGVLLESASQETLYLFGKFGVDLWLGLLDVVKDVADTGSEVQHLSMHHFVHHCTDPVDVSSLCCLSTHSHLRC